LVIRNNLPVISHKRRICCLFIAIWMLIIILRWGWLSIWKELVIKSKPWKLISNTERNILRKISMSITHKRLTKLTLLVRSSKCHIDYPKCSVPIILHIMIESPKILNFKSSQGLFIGFKKLLIINPTLNSLAMF